MDSGTAPPSNEDTRAGPTGDATDESLDRNARVAELEDQWRRTAADLDNLRKRYRAEADRMRAAERANVAAEWLPVLDGLELALAHAAADPETIVEGVRGVRDQAVEVLARLGFPRRVDEGLPFDPVLHEAVAVLPVEDLPAGTVVQVVRPGYGTDEHLLRPAAVVVAQG